MQPPILVYVDPGGAQRLAGRLWTRTRHARESATFEYDRGWLADPARFALEPALQLGPGPYHTDQNRTLFGAIGDSAPDRWGRTLMRRAERRRAERSGETPRALREIDYLLLVDDEARQGALRFAATEGGPFLAASEATRIPPLLELPKLLSAAERVLEDRDEEQDLRLLLAPGSSLGGARPKASVRDRDGRLAIAKFPHSADRSRVVLWEGVALRMAARAGVTVPEWRIERCAGKPVLLLARFDRTAARARVPFLSAQSMLQARDHETRSYLELADALRRHGAEPRKDMHQLWRRVVFNILISNTDDHLRNHAFLYAGAAGWRLAPAYDLNPVPSEVKPRILSTSISEDDPTANLDLALEVCGHFELPLAEAKRIAAEVGRVAAAWRSAARAAGLSPAEAAEMASAFEHEDLKRARALA